MAGVNGSGKTTSIAKLARREMAESRRVMLAASDTFRAAATEQIALWAGRLGCDLVKHGQGADPAAVAFDALSAAKARGTDLLIVDTAGRMHTDRNLLAEIQKVQRVLGKALPGAPHETLLVLDATAGQNALAQARAFQAGLQVTGIILTKLDGTAKGGIVVAIQESLGLPVRFVGLGEGLLDLEPFDPEAFVEALLGTERAT
jgi:fused signal recognition particle receptor